MSGQAKGILEVVLLKAVALDREAEPRVLRLNRVADGGGVRKMKGRQLYGR